MTLDSMFTLILRSDTNDPEQATEERRVQLIEMQEAYEKLLANKPEGVVVPEDNHVD